MNYSSKDLVSAPMVPLPGAPGPYLFQQAQPKQLSVRDLWDILIRRKALIGILALALFVAAAVFCGICIRRYQAIGTVQVQRESSDALNLEDMTGPSAGSADALDQSVTMQTQAEVLQSKSLALQVIKDLNLDRTPDFQHKPGPLDAVIDPVMSLFVLPGPPDPANAPLDEAPNRRASNLKTFAKRLKVATVPGTRLIEIKFSNPDPVLAAAVVNHLVQDLIDYNFRVRYDATQKAAGWLNNQLSDLRKQSEDLQARVAQLQRDSGVFTSGATDQEGREQLYAPVLDRLQQATAAVTQAQSARILKGALYQVVKDGDPELISGLVGSSMLSQAPAGFSTSLSLIQNLRAQEATQQAQFDELSAKFGPGYPKLIELRASLEGVRKSIQAEASRLSERVKNDYVISQQVEDGARKTFENEKRDAEALNNRTIEYQIARQEAQQSTSLYNSLLGRLKEAGVVAGLRSSNISVVDPARVPATPSSPNVPLFLGAGLGAGLFIGVTSAFLRDAWDGAIYDLSALESLYGSALLGILPFYHSRRRLRKLTKQSLSGAASLSVTADAPGEAAVLLEPRSTYAEALRALRTTLLSSSSSEQPKVILVTSAEPGEGKSMLSLNLAALLRQPHRKVLLVDADFRRPALAGRFNIKPENGLSSLLGERRTAETEASAIVPVTGNAGLFVVPSGPLPDHPAEALASHRIGELIRAWREEYDFVIIDAPPVLPVTDSVLLSRHADMTLLVARYKRTEANALERSYRLLKSQTAGAVAIVVNAVPAAASSYRRYFGYNYATYLRREKSA